MQPESSVRHSKITHWPESQALFRGNPRENTKRRPLAKKTINQSLINRTSLIINASTSSRPPAIYLPLFHRRVYNLLDSGLLALRPLQTNYRQTHLPPDESHRNVNGQLQKAEAIWTGNSHLDGRLTWPGSYKLPRETSEQTSTYNLVDCREVLKKV